MEQFNSFSGGRALFSRINSPRAMDMFVSVLFFVVTVVLLDIYEFFLVIKITTVRMGISNAFFSITTYFGVGIFAVKTFLDVAAILGIILDRQNAILPIPEVGMHVLV
jgi:hypothetical protein